MKKVLLLVGLLILSQNFVQAETPIVQNATSNQPKMVTLRPHKEHPFEVRLGLTESQKMKAREVRFRGHEKLYPVAQQIAMLKQEAQMVKNSRIAVEVQEERLAKIDNEIKKLEKEAHKIKKENFKEFEAILTKAQRNTLKQMKQEGRQRYHEQHPSKNSLIKPQNRK